MAIIPTEFVTAIKDILELKAINKHKKDILGYVKESPVTKYLLDNKEAVLLIGLVIVVALSILAFVLIKCLLNCKNPKVVKVMEKLDKILLFSMLLRTILAVFLNLCLTAFAGFFLPDSKSFLANYIFTGIVTGFTITTLFVAWKGGPSYLN